jgi:hypothetical protein
MIRHGLVAMAATFVAGLALGWSAHHVTATPALTAVLYQAPPSQEIRT